MSRQPTLSSPALTIVPGRVMSLKGLHARVEFSPDSRPGVGVVLRHQDSLLEVVAVENLSEVLATLRRGPMPERGAHLNVHSPGLRLTRAHLKWGQRAHPTSAPDLTEDTVPLASPMARADTPDSPADDDVSFWWTGHPGVDLTAPLADRGALAVVDTRQETLDAWARAHLPHLAAARGAGVLWVSASAERRPPEALRGRCLHLCAEHGVGEVALLWRAARQIADQLQERDGAPLLTVLDSPMDVLLAWQRAAGQGPSSAPLATASFRDALTALTRSALGPRALIILRVEDPLRDARRGPGNKEPESFADALASFDAGVLEPLSARSRFRSTLPAAMAALSESCLEIMASAEALGDHALIFGAQELDEGADELRQTQEALSAWLCDPPDAAQRPEDVLARGHAILLGATP